MKGDIPHFKEKLESYKREFTKHNLVLSEEAYVELKATPEGNLSLKEFIQVKVYEALMGYCEDLNSNQGENKKLFHDLQVAKNRIEKDEIEINALRTQIKQIKEDADRRVSALERRNLELETDNKQVKSQYKLLSEKSGKITK